VRHLSSSRTFAVLAAFLLTAVLAACGSGEQAAPQNPGAAPPAGTPFPVTIEHAFGTTTVERAPERVVTLGVTDADAVLALGTTPSR
jgi:iron complex transport system substrate-binding protein